MYLSCRPLVPLTSDMSQHDSGLRISTARNAESTDKAAEEEQPGSAIFYSPSASQDASPASKSACCIMLFKASMPFSQPVSLLRAFVPPCDTCQSCLLAGCMKQLSLFERQTYCCLYDQACACHQQSSLAGV